VNTSLTRLFGAPGLALALALAGWAGNACADLCAGCAEKAFTADVGKCSACGAQTPSSGYRFCKSCAAKAGRCEACGAKLAAARARPTPLFADEQWYKDQPGNEAEFIGVLEAAPAQAGADTRMRASFYRLGERAVYTGAKKAPALDALVGKRVLLAGKAVDMELGGRRVREIWPASVCAAPRPDKVLGRDDSGKTIAVAAGDLVEIRLEGNPTTGFMWSVAGIEGDAIASMGDVEYVQKPAPRGMVGVGGTFVVNLRAARPGKAAVACEYKRPWEKDTAPAGRFAVTLAVQPAAQPPRTQ